MTSVNKIKELANAHEYSLAAPILDSQDLDKSYNPQFLRICGEVYENVGRLSEARYLYVKAHTLAPEATRIIYSLIDYYLRVGYFDLADRYFDEFIFFSKEAGRELSNVKYIMKKAKAPDLEELYDIIFPYYRDNMDEYWSFELLCLSKLLDKGDMDIISNDYKATFKSGIYLPLVDSVLEEKSAAWDNFFVYAEKAVEDNKPEEEETRKMEQEQLEKDYYVMNPESREAVITEMVSAEEKKKDFDFKNIEGVEKGLKRFIKKKFKKKDKDAEEDKETTEGEVAEGEETEGEAPETEAEGAEAKQSGEAEENDSTEASGEGEKSADGEAEQDIELADPTDATPEDAQETEAEETEEESPEEEFEEEFVTYEFDDGFAPVSDTIAGLSEADFLDVDESISDSSSVFREFAEYQSVNNSEPDIFVPEEEEEPEIYIPEPESEPVVEEVEEPEPEPVVEEVEEPEPEPEPEPVVEEVEEPEPEPVVEEVEEPEPEPVVEEVTEPEPEAVVEELEIDDEITEETVEEPVEEVVEETVEEPAEEVVEQAVEETVEEPVEEVVEETVEEPAEEVVEEAVEEPVEEVVEETVEEPAEEDIEETVEEPVEEVVEETVEEPAEEDIEETVEEPVEEVVEETVEETVEEPEPIPSYMKNDIPSMDFSQFSSDLFPTLGRKETVTENRFNDVVKVESEKLDAGLMEEEAKLKEAEALLASLGIKL